MLVVLRPGQMNALAVALKQLQLAAALIVPGEISHQVSRQVACQVGLPRTPMGVLYLRRCQHCWLALHHAKCHDPSLGSPPRLRAQTAHKFHRSVETRQTNDCLHPHST